MLRFTTFQVSVLCVLLFLLGFSSYRIYEQNTTRQTLEQQLLTQGFEALPEPVEGTGTEGADPIEKHSGEDLLAIREQMKININTAEASELNQLPGIGPSTAQNIIDYRKENGPFKSIDELTNVSRIGEKLVAKIREQVTTGTPEPPAEEPAEVDPNAVPEETLDEAAADASHPSGSRSAKPKLTGRVDVNTASAAELELLPKIGPSTAKAIIEYRTKNGPFRKAEDLEKVPRIGAKTVASLRPHITLSGAVPSGASSAPAADAAPAGDAPSADKPAGSSGRSSRGSSKKELAAGQKININTASEAELTSLPGVGPSTAQKIVEHRAVNGPFTKIEDIMKVKGIGKAKFAKMQDHLSVQ